MEESIYRQYARQIRVAASLGEAEKIMREIVDGYSQEAYERGFEDGRYPLGRGWD